MLSQLVGYTPGDTSRVVAAGTAGTADPGVAVVLVNEATNEVETVLSKVDGSFASHIRADAADLVSATFVNANGTRVHLPAARQLFDDGRVGLFRAGGILEAETDGGPVRVIVDPDTVPERTVFSVQSVGLPELLTLVESVVPPDTALVGGVRVTAEPQLNHSVHLAFPVNPATLNLPPGMAPEDVPFTIAQPEVIDGTQVFNVVEKATFKDGQVRTASPPFDGAIPPVPPLPGAQIATVPFMAFAVLKTVAVIGGIVIAVPEGTKPKDYATVADVAAHNFDRVPGAIVSAFFQDQSAGLSRGAFVTRANGAGFYAIQVPIQGPLDAVAMQAFSFRFPGKVAITPATTAGVFGPAEPRHANIAFTKPAPGSGPDDKLAPFATIEAQGFLPVDQTVSVFVNTIDNASVPMTISSDWIKCPPGAPVTTPCSKSLEDGKPLDVSDVSFMELFTQPTATHAVRTEFTFRVKKPAIVFLNVKVGDAAGNQREFIFPLQFRPEPPTPPGNLTPSDPNDTTPPTVLSVFPGGGATVTAGDEVLVKFSEAISLTAETTPCVLATGSNRARSGRWWT